MFAQTFGNEWIDYSANYFKIPVVADGMSTINHSTLATALTAKGVSISGIDPRNIQLYHRGEECSIKIEGEADGSFDASDLLYFYGKRNDGTLDSAM